MWDARIHQKAKGKKQDGTWKLIKGVDKTLVENVVRELAASKLPPNAAPAGVNVGAAPPAPPASVAPPVPLPPADIAAGTGTVPMPPQPGTVPAPPSGMPAQTVSPPVPVPPGATAAAVPAAPGTLGAPGPYRALIDKITEATKTNKLTAQQVLAIVHDAGAPNLMQLNQFPHLIEVVSSGIDLALAGLA